MFELCIKVTDEDRLVLEQNINIDILDILEASTEIRLSNDKVRENEPIGTVVGELSTFDNDVGDFFT